MSITQNTLIGRTRQSIGGATFSTWKGLNVLKSKPITVANPKTSAQIYQRDKLKNAVMLYRLASFIFDVGFKEEAIHMSPYNAFTSENLRNNSIGGTSEATILDPSEFKTAKGSLYGTPISTAVVDFSDLSVTVTFPTTATADQLASDFAWLLAYDSNGNFLGSSDGTQIRSGGTADFNAASLPAAGQTVHVYLFFTQPTTGKASDSAYTSSVVVA